MGSGKLFARFYFGQDVAGRGDATSAREILKNSQVIVFEDVKPFEAADQPGQKGADEEKEQKIGIGEDGLAGEPPLQKPGVAQNLGFLIESNCPSEAETTATFSMNGA